MKALIISLLPSITAVLGMICTAIGIISKIKNVFSNTSKENKELKQALIKSQKDNATLKESVDHLIKIVNKIKEK